MWALVPERNHLHFQRLRIKTSAMWQMRMSALWRCPAATVRSLEESLFLAVMISIKPPMERITQVRTACPGKNHWSLYTVTGFSSATHHYLSLPDFKKPCKLSLYNCLIIVYISNSILVGIIYIQALPNISCPKICLNGLIHIALYLMKMEAKK